MDPQRAIRPALGQCAGHRAASDRPHLGFSHHAGVPSKNLIETVVADGTVGLYLGWVTIATVANVAAVLVAAGFDGWGLPADLWGVVVIAIAGTIGIGLALYGRGRLAPSASLCWGIGWVAVGRLTGDLVSVPTAVASVAAVAAIVIATVGARIKAPRPLPADD